MDNNKTSEHSTDDELLRKQKAKEAALLRYINESESNIYDDLSQKSGGNAFKEAISGFFYTLYLIFLHPLVSNRTLRRKLLMKIIFALIIILAAKFFAPQSEYSTNNVQQNIADTSVNMP